MSSEHNKKNFNNSLFNSTVLFMAYKLRIVLIFKLVLDASFVCARTIKCFCWHGSKSWLRRWWAGATHTPNFVISSQDFHIGYVKSVKIHKYLAMRPGSSQNGRFQEEPGGEELSSQNVRLPFKAGEFEHMYLVSIE